MNEDNDQARDIAVLDNLELALRNHSAVWEAVWSWPPAEAPRGATNASARP